MAMVATVELVGRRWARSWEQEGDGGRLPSTGKREGSGQIILHDLSPSVQSNWVH